jgi:hypothetical protein
MVVADVGYLGTANGSRIAFNRCAAGANCGIRYTDGAILTEAGAGAPGSVPGMQFTPAPPWTMHIE